MKKFILSLTVVLLSLTSFAQAESPHLSFKGVPIDGTLNEYVQKMRKKGFTTLGTEDGVAILKGEFASYKGCVVGVYTLKQKDLVSTIRVVFPQCETWALLSNNYFTLKDMLMEKYGKPADEMEEFQSRYEPRDDSYKLANVRLGRCKFMTVFETPKGQIILSIDHTNEMDCFVKLSYFDKINGDVVRSQAIDDL